MMAEKGESLYKFRTPYCLLILALLIPFLLIFIYLLFIGIWHQLVVKKDIVAFLIIFIVWLFCSQIYYLGFLMAFENVIIFEKGLYPPIGQESGIIKTLIQKRTFIPFSKITDARLFVGPRLNDVITVRYQKQTWEIIMGKNTKIISSILDEGIRNRYLKKPNSTKP
jgi:hypothetical protein